MSCGVGLRCGLDPMLLWLWHRLVATALFGPLAWEPPYALGVALKKNNNNTLWDKIPHVLQRSRLLINVQLCI